MRDIITESVKARLLAQKQATPNSPARIQVSIEEIRDTIGGPGSLAAFKANLQAMGMVVLDEDDFTVTVGLGNYSPCRWLTQGEAPC